MRILLIMADAQMHKFHLGSFTRSSREVPLSLSSLAALAPAPDLEYRLVDESVEPVPLDWPADLVGISVLTGTARRAYALADHYRRRGVPVVLGGVHVTLLPDEAARYADSVVVGMAEQSWPRLVADLRAGRLQPRYEQEPSTSDVIEGLPTPRWDLHTRSRYMVPYTVQATRGCVHRCDFCTVPAVWDRFQRRPVEEVLRDARAVPGRRFAISDVSPFDDLDYAKELLRGLAKVGKTWGGLATTRIADDPEVLELLRASGCRFLLIGFESVSQRSLNRIYKGFNQIERYRELMRRLRSVGVLVQGCFVFGFDEDGPEIFAETVEQVQALKIDIPRYSIYTPYPGSLLYQRLEAEGRILSRDWSDYDTMHVVHRPKGMSPVELYEGFRWAYRKTFELRSILRRTLAARASFPIALAGNLTYRLYVKRLLRGRGFEMPLAAGTTPGVPERA